MCNSSNLGNHLHLLISAWGLDILKTEFQSVPVEEARTAESI